MIKQDFHIEFKEAWEKLVKQELDIWIGHHRWWLEKAKEMKMPLLFFRFEDVLMDSKQVLEEVFTFMLEVEDIEGTVIQTRIQETIAKGKEASQLYKPRSGAMNKNAHRYSPELIEYIKEKAGDLLYFFGYVNFDENPTGFFNFDTHSEENLQKNYGFRQFNKEQH